MAYRWTDGEITLRPSTEGDWVHFYREYFDSAVRFFFYTEAEPPLDERTAQARFAAFLGTAKEKNRLDLTAENAAGEVVGSVNLYDVDVRAGTFQAAVFVCAAARGKGVARRMLGLLLGYAFDELRLNKFNARVVAGNEPSRRLHESLGCRLEGVRRAMFFHEGKYLDELDYGMTADEWRAAVSRP